MSEENNIMVPHRAQWKSHIGFLLAAIGSAIGLGNIWRFPYLCYQNGGGAFLIPYAVALLTVGIPLMILEIGLGHKMRGSAPMSFAKINKHWEWLGWWSVIFVMFGIMLYYSVVIAWCLNYLFFSFNLSWGSDPNAFFFKDFLNLTQSPSQLGDVRTHILFALAFVWIAAWLIVFFGVQRGVERANKIFMPVLFILTTILIIWSVNLPGAREGIKWYLKPDFSLLSKPRVWVDAFSQIFFSLSIGFGIMIAYASYLPRRANIVRDSITISVTNCLYSIFAGFAVFGTLGYMALTTKQPFNEIVSESIGLAFVAYPKAISLLPGLSQLFGVFFFGTLVLAGLSSAISILEAFGCAVCDKFHYPRRWVVTFISILGFFGSIIFATGGGLFWLDIVDHFITHYGLVTVGILECILVGWIFKNLKLDEFTKKLFSRPFWGSLWDISIKFVTPVLLTLVLINDIIKEIGSSYGDYSRLANILIGRDWLIVLLFVAIVVAAHPWKVDIHKEQES